MSRGWIAIAFAVCASCAAAQNGGRDSATARLTVSATILGSSGVVFGQNGELKILVANAPAAEVEALAENAILLGNKHAIEHPYWARSIRPGPPPAKTSRSPMLNLTFPRQTRKIAAQTR